MNITTITVSYGETQSLPEYSNVKPLLSITATLDEGEDVALIEAQLWEHAKDAVHAQIDLALEANDKPAKYSTEPRYQVMKTARNDYFERGKPEPPRLVVILPDALNPKDATDRARLVHAAYGASRNLRYAHALRVAHEAAESYEGAAILDCSDGDLTPLETALTAQTPALAAVAGDLSDEDYRGYKQADDTEDDRDDDDFGGDDDDDE